MIISQLEHEPSVSERVEKNKHCSIPTWIAMKTEQPLDLQPFFFLEDFLQLSEVGVCICLKSNTSDFHRLFSKRRVECLHFWIYTITRLAFLQLVKWQTVENFSYLAISFRVGSSPWNETGSILRERRDCFGSQWLTPVISLLVRSSRDVPNFKSLLFCS